MRMLFLTLAWLLGAAPVLAHDLAVSVRDGSGHPVADAVVTLQAPGAPPLRTAGPYQMSQKAIAFHPFVLVVPVGATVAFPNNDKVRHHVYSFSPAKRFELKLYSGEESRSVTFDKPGVVALGCNIHDRMMAFIDVVDTPWAAKTDAEGKAVIADVPTGTATLTVWHPFLKARANQMTRSVALSPAPAPAESFVVDLQPPLAPHVH